MNLVLTGAVVLLGLIAIGFLVFRKGKEPEGEGRPDRLERPELRGSEQSKRRELP